MLQNIQVALSVMSIWKMSMSTSKVLPNSKQENLMLVALGKGDGGEGGVTKREERHGGRGRGEGDERIIKFQLLPKESNAFFLVKLVW